MKTRVDGRLLAEAARFSFRFACDDCAHFDASIDRCSLGYPAAPRRGALAAQVAAVSGAEVDIELCKAFELA